MIGEGSDCVLSDAYQAKNKLMGLPIIMGGVIAPNTRAAVGHGERARIDVLEMERVFGSSIYDFGFLSRAARHSVRARAALLAAQRSGQWSQSLAAEVLTQVQHHEVIYATGEDVGFALAAQARALGFRKPRIAVRLEQPDYGQTPLRRGLYEQYRAYALRRVSRVICRTTAHMQKLSSIDRYPFEQLHFVRETTDPRFYNPSTLTTDSVTYDQGNDPLIVSAGLEERDYATLIEAVRDLPVRVVIGAGSPWSHARFGRSDPSSIPFNVRIGQFSPSQMRALYRTAALVVVPVEPTLRACGMNVVLEAWAMGRAVLATRTAGLRDYITDEVDGLFVEPRNATAMRRGIERLLNDSTLATRLGRAGRCRVVEDLNLDRYIERIAAILDSALNDKL